MTTEPSVPALLPSVPRKQPTRATDGAVLEALLSGRGLAAVGVLLMLIGGAFFIDLSFARGWIAPGERIALGLIVGAGLLALFTRFLSSAYRVAAEALTALGAGLIFVASWAGTAIFPELHVPTIAAFLTMAAGAASLVVISARWRSEPVALMGLAGAYLTPFLLSATWTQRWPLAAYLIIATGGLLVLARRRRFHAVEIAAALAPVLYAYIFVPNVVGGWSEAAAAGVASAFYVMFAVAATTRPIAGDAVVPLARAPLAIVTALYIALLEIDLGGQPRTAAAALLALAAVLAAAPRLRSFVPRELADVYRGFALLALNLGLRSLLHRTSLLDALAIEAAALALLGARERARILIWLSGALFAFVAGGLLFEAFTHAPARTLVTPLAAGFIVCVASLLRARRAFPDRIQTGVGIAARALLLVGVTRGVLDALGGPTWSFFALPSVAQFALSLAWAAFAAIVFSRGVALRNVGLRCEGLAVFVVAIVKVLTVDVAALDIVYRIGTFVGTGAALFACAAWYLHAEHQRAEEQHEIGPAAA